MGFSLKGSHLSRYKDIVSLFIKYGRGDLVGDASLEQSNGRHSEQPSIPEGSKAAQLATDLEKMGPTFIKVGQLLSTRPDMLPPAYIVALARLQDKVEPFPYEQVAEIVQTELGVKLSRAFSSFDPVPVAAASLGQVHHATLRDGRPVAVKVQRPHIRERMVEDLDSLHEVAEFLDNHTEMGKRFEFQRILNEFRRTLLRELDYRMEAQNLATLAENIKEFPRIIVPLPVHDFTTSRVLTMEFVSGYKLKELSPLIKTELDGADLAEELFQAYLKQILVDGFFHADPHPGNVLITQDSKVALLDLGMVARVSPRVQEGLLNILMSISEGKGEEAATAMIDISEKKDDFNEREFLHRAVDLVGLYQNVTLHRMAMGKVVMEISNMASDCGLRPAEEFTTLGKTLLNLDQLAVTLNPDFNPNESIRRNAASIVQQRMMKELNPARLYRKMLDGKEFLERLPGRVTKILDAVANNEIEIKVDAINEDKLMAGFQKVANRITVGLIMGAMIIGAALLMRVETSWKIWGYPGLAMTLFLLVAVGGGILVVNILFRDEHA